MGLLNIQNSEGLGDGGSGLDNLFALAHLAVMTGGERDVLSSSSSSQTASPSTLAASPGTTEEKTAPPLPNDRAISPARRPAKKRAVPADFDVPSVILSPDVAATSASQTQTRKPCVSIPKAAAKSEPAAKRSKKTQPNQQQGRSETFKMKANQPPFPIVLMGMMSTPQNRDFISFLSDGKSLIIINPEALEKFALPLHFDDNVPTFDQFLHLLSTWGFEIMNDPQFPQVNVYRHPMFRKGEWEACMKMKLPDQISHQAMGAVKSESSQIATKGLGGSSNTHPLEPHAMLCQDFRVANNLFLPLKAARSVTPPDATLYDVSMLKQMATQTRQHQQQQQYAYLGSKRSAIEEDVHCLRLIQESMGRPGTMPDRVSSFQHPGLPRGSPQKGKMMEYSNSSIMDITLPPHNRQVSLDLGSMPSLAIGNGAIQRKFGNMMSPPDAAGFLRCGQFQQQQPVRRQATSYSDAQVRCATEIIVSDAINVLRKSDGIHQHQAQKRSNLGSTRNNSGSLSNSLDAMAEFFLEQRQAGLPSHAMTMTGLRNNASLSQQNAVPAMSMQLPQPFSRGSNATVDEYASRHSLIDSARGMHCFTKFK